MQRSRCAPDRASASTRPAGPGSSWPPPAATPAVPPGPPRRYGLLKKPAQPPTSADSPSSPSRQGVPPFGALATDRRPAPRRPDGIAVAVEQAQLLGGDPGRGHLAVRVAEVESAQQPGPGQIRV